MTVALKNKLTEFKVLSKHQIEQITGAVIEKNFKKGEYFLRASEANKELGFLVSGIFRYYTINDEGDEDTSMFITENSFFTELESFHEQTLAEGYLQAESEASVLVFKRDAYLRLIREIDELEFVFKRLSQDRLTEHLKLSREVVTLEAKDAYLLMQQEYPSIVSLVPSNHLASFLGITKHSLSRIKKKISETSA